MTRARSHYHNRLRKHRRIMGYTQKDVAWLLGLKDTSNLSRWEKGVSLPSVKNLIRLSILYRTLCDELYFDLGQNYKTKLLEKEEDWKCQNN